MLISIEKSKSISKCYLLKEKGTKKKSPCANFLQRYAYAQPLAAFRVPILFSYSYFSFQREENKQC